jgi:hypothetical protein
VEATTDGAETEERAARMNLIEQSHAEFEKGMAKAVSRHRTNAALEAVNEALLYARDQLNVMIEEMQVQGLQAPGTGIPPIQELEARLEVVELVVSERPKRPKGENDV